MIATGLRRGLLHALLLVPLLAGGAGLAGAESAPIPAAPAAIPDPAGVLRKPIPDRLVVLTFDDGPASHATVVAPVLKSLDFGGSFYVCDFDSFHTRKDWYLTYRQMKAMAADGFEIGNHTVGHGGGLANYLALEDQLLAHHVSKPTTVCWPVYDAVKGIYQDLSSHGYTFGRGGHERPYRPTVDNAFDIPSFTMRDGIPVETFAKHAQKACGGNVVVFCFHGVPDMEHPSVGLEPETFKQMMRYLKDNQYQCIALRDLDRYIDPVKAMALPHTVRNPKDMPPFPSLRDDKPHVAPPGKELLGFHFPGMPTARRVKGGFTISVPFATDLASLAPRFAVSPGAVAVPASGAATDFSKPVTYTVTSADGEAATHTVTVTRTPASADKEVLSFTAPGASPASISGPRIAAHVPASADLRALAPTFTLSPFATASPPSGTPRDFTRPQTYTITAQDGSARSATVMLVKSDKPVAFTWKEAETGAWGDAARWADNLAAGAVPDPAGRPDYILHFGKAGKFAATHNLDDAFQLNQLQLSQTRGLRLDGKSIALVANPVTGNLPAIQVNTPSESDQVSIPMRLAADVTVNVMLRGRLTIQGLISGDGGLTLNCPGATDEDYSRWGILRIDNKANTYTGGTVINGGQLFLFVASRGLGSGPVTLNPGGDIRLEGVQDITNPLTVNGGTIEGGGSWNAPIVLNGAVRLAGHIRFNETAGGISGPGGVTQIGSIGAFGRVNSGEISLCAANTYTGPTTVRMGTLVLRKAASLYNADTSAWTAARITVHPAATLRVAAGGPGEFTGEQIGTLLANLTAKVDGNGLMERAVFCVDTARAADPVTVTQPITDSNGPGGGAFVLKKAGAGTLRLAGAGTHTGRTVLEAGALSVSSLNRVAGGAPASCLGAPRDVEGGEIAMGSGEGEVTLIYTGPGESCDRVLNLAGRKSTVVLDQSGAGPLRLTADLLISGFGTSKTIVLKGDGGAPGEFAGRLSDPHDRAGKATTAITKAGAGTWTLSGVNTHSGPTTVAQGTLSLANPRSLGGRSEVHVADGATLDLAFEGEMGVGRLHLGGKPQPAGAYRAKDAPEHLRGAGVLLTQ